MSNGMFTDGGRVRIPEIPPEEDMRPREDIESEDSIFQVLYDTIIGEQGIPEGVSAEAIAAIRGDFGPTSTPDELREVAQQIADAGGFDEWYAQQDLEGPPEELPTELEEEPYEPVEIDDPFIDYDPVFPIELPEPEGGGATAAPEVTEDVTEETPTTVEAGAGDIEPEAGYVYEGGGIFRDQETGRVVEQEIQGDDPYVVGEVYSTGPTPIQEDVTADDTTRPGVGIVFAPVTTPSTGTDTTGTAGEGTTVGDGTGDDAGDGTGTGERRGMFEDKFTPFMTSIGYTPVQLQQLVTPPKKDYMRELDGLFGRLLG